MDRNIRAAALGLGLAWLAIAPTPDGTISALDRQQIAGHHRSPAAGSPAVVLPARQITLLASTRAHALGASHRTHGLGASTRTHTLTATKDQP
jgi:hypothetical protein